MLRNTSFKEFIPLIVILSIGTVFYHFVENFSWVDAIYFSVIALTTAGFGDVIPVTDIGKLFTIVYILSGFGIMLNFINMAFDKRQKTTDKILK